MDTSPPAGTSLTTTANNAVHGYAVGPERRSYFTNNGPIFLLAPSPAPTATMASITDIKGTSATFNGTVTPPPPGPEGGYTTFYHFEYSTNGASWIAAPTIPVQVGSDHVKKSVSYTAHGLQPNQDYLVRLVASTGTEATTTAKTFATPPAPPTVSRTTAIKATQSSAQLMAYVNPNNSPTTYHFEWGPSPRLGTQTPNFEAFAGSGGQPQRVSVNIAGLQPNRTYYFRVVATNTASGTTEGPGQRFTTLNVSGLPNNRRYELASPAVKAPASQVGAWVSSEMFYLVADDGQNVMYPLTFGLLGATAGGDLRYWAARNNDGWTSVQGTPANIGPPVQQGNASEHGKYVYISRDATCRVMVSRDKLAADAPTEVLGAGGFNLYRQNADGTYTVLNPAPTNPTLPITGFASGVYTVIGASSDCNRIVFETKYTYPNVGESGLYEWDHGTLRNLGVLPDASVPAAAWGGFRNVPGVSGEGSIERAVSRDGTRVFYTALSSDGNDAGTTALFVRAGGAATTKVSASQTATPNRGAAFQTASTDGNSVLFLANYGLTATTSAGPTDVNCTAVLTNPEPRACDLYRYDLDTGILTDVSADTDDGSGAMVGGVLGASEDLSYIYFAAQGQLVPDAGQTYQQNALTQNYNVYASHAGRLSFVGLVTQNDLVASSGTTQGAALGASFSPGTGNWASQVTPDGRHIVFPSTAKVTGYDSHGVSEAYLYSADTDTTLCVSCRQDGRPPVQPPSGAYYLLPRANAAYSSSLERPRAISDDGSRVFFTMADELAVGAVGGQSNVYEWENGQVYLLATGDWGESSFIGASTSGNDVFIITSRKLVPQDNDLQRDVYDVRVNGGFPAPPAPSAPCNPLVVGACEGPLVAPPGITQLGSATLSGVGNVPPPAAPSSTSKGKSKRRLRVSKPKTAYGTSTRIRVEVPAKGKIRTSGSGLKRSSRTAKRAGGTYRVAVRLSNRARRTLRHRGRVRVRVTVRFTPKQGKKEGERVQVTFRAKAAKKHGANASRRTIASTRRITVSVGSHGKVR